MKRLTKWIYVAVLPLSLGILNGCSDNDAVSPLPEPVPLKMSVSTTDLVMGESFDLKFEVTGTEEGKTQMNEDLSIKLSATMDNNDVDRLLFDDFPTEVILKAGEKEHVVTIPVKSTGLNREYSVELNAFARGYKLTGSKQNLTISDYHYSTVTVKNNADMTVKEGQTFVLVASVNTELKDDLTITITPKEGEESYYENLPSQLVIAAGTNSVESDAITMVKSTTTIADVDLTLNLATVPAVSRYPLTANSIVISRPDLHKGLDSDKGGDERWLYEDPDMMYVSPSRENAVKQWGQSNYQIMKEGDPHPNSGKVLPEGKWKFWRAYEFHHISACMTKKTSLDASFESTEYPLGFADQNTSAVETAGGVDNAKYAWITDEGYLRMISLKEKTKTTSTGTTKNFGTSAFYANKFMRGNSNSPTWNSSNIRIYPGMRIETRARIRGAENSGMLPGIWLQGNEQVGGLSEWNNWPDFGEIDVMENNTKGTYKKTVEQTFHIGNVTPNTGGSGHYNPTTYGVSSLNGKISEFQIYWMEWADDKTVIMGVNGKETIRITEADATANGGRWPFSYSVNNEGLYYILSMMFLNKAEPDYPSMEMSYATARKMLKSNPNALIPRMEIDWVRFYIDDTYSDHNMPYRKDLILY